jgi:hypothetical protein
MLLDPADADFQTGFHAALWSHDPPAGLTAPDPTEIARRFAVYRNNVQHSLTRALAARFPAVERLVGAEFFAAMARAFIAAHPPDGPVLLQWGGAFIPFLTGFPPVAHLPWLACVARLELARGHAYHAADTGAVGADILTVPDPAALRLALHPSVTLFASDYPAVAIWQSQQPDAARVPLPAGPSYALIARGPDLDVIVAPLDAGSFKVLSALSAAQPLGQAAHLADPTTALALLLRHSLIIGEVT